MSHTVATTKLATVKRAAIDPITALLGAGSVAAGAVAVNDIYKSMGMGRDQREVQRAISSKRAIDVSEYVRKIDPKIKVIDTIAKAKAMVKDEIKHPVTRALALMEMSELVTMGNNAGALRGKFGEYLICAGKLPQEIIDHEIGHLLDFRAKGLTFDKQGPYKTGFLQSIWKPTYNRQVMAAEQAAWAHVPDSRHKRKTERHALGTYDKGFHVNRLELAFPLAAALGMYAISRSLEKKGTVSDQDRAKTRFKKLRGALDTEGVMIGAHKRIAIPKSALSEQDLTKHLGFTPVKIAIPEQGQKRFTSFRHEKHNYHIHDHDSHWTMHRDEHPAATMVIRRMLKKSKGQASDGVAAAGEKAKGIGHAIAQRARTAAAISKAVVGGIPHVVTEGAPGAYYYAKGRLTGAGSTLQTVLSKQRGDFKRRMGRWRPTRATDQDKTAAFGPHVDAAVRDLRARGHDRLARALLRSGGDIVGRKRAPRELMALARMARAPNTSPLITRGITEAVSDVPELWDLIVRGAPPARQQALASAATARIRGEVLTPNPASSHWRWSPNWSAGQASRAPRAAQGMSTGARIALGLGAALVTGGAAAYAWNKGTEPKYKYPAQEKAATAVVQDYAARAHIDATRQVKSRMTQMRPAINTSTFRALRPQRPTVPRPAVSAVRSASSGLGAAIKGAMK